MIGWIVSICVGIGIIITACAIVYAMVKYDADMYVLFFMLVISALVLTLNIHQYF